MYTTYCLKLGLQYLFIYQNVFFYHQYKINDIHSGHIWLASLNLATLVLENNRAVIHTNSLAVFPT